MKIKNMKNKYNNKIMSAISIGAGTSTTSSTIKTGTAALSGRSIVLGSQQPYVSYTGGNIGTYSPSPYGAMHSINISEEDRHRSLGQEFGMYYGYFLNKTLAEALTFEKSELVLVDLIDIESQYAVIMTKKDKFENHYFKDFNVYNYDVLMGTTVLKDVPAIRLRKIKKSDEEKEGNNGTE